MQGLRDTAHVNISPAALGVLETIEHAGFEAWLVGGCVRDALIGRNRGDVDLATSATWQQVQQACTAAGMAVHETGTAHGTVTVVNDGEVVEVTTYRIDGDYRDARHPESVQFTSSIVEDLARRDFTINAMAWHPARGLLDPFGGSTDLDAGVIRAVGNPDQRFEEDALRILRAVRFASQLGFSIDPATAAGMNAHAGSLARISVERVLVELEALLLGDAARSVLMNYPQVIDAVLPELTPMRGLDQRTPYHVYDVMEHTAYVVEHSPATPLVRWAALFHDSGKPDAFFVDDTGRGHFYGHAIVSVDIAREALGRLKMNHALLEQILLLVRYHDKAIKPAPKFVKRTLRLLGDDPELFEALCDLKRADSLAHAPEHQAGVEKSAQLRDCLHEVLDQEQAFALKHLAIDGTDVIDAGVAKGPAIGEVLEQVLEAVISDEVPNERDALLAFVRTLTAERP